MNELHSLSNQLADVVASIAPSVVQVQHASGVVYADNVVVTNARALGREDGLHVRTHDNRTLLIAESYAHGLTGFDIEADGTLSNRRTWADLGEDYPDGITIDAEGAVWYAVVPSRHCVRVREGGEVLQTIPADRGCFACMLGGADGRTLFVCTSLHSHPVHCRETRTGRIEYCEVDVPHAGLP